MERRLHQLLPLGILLEILVLIAAYFESDGNTVLFFQVAARLSGRVSLLFFSIFVVYATLHPSVEKDSNALNVKYFIARDFAIIHIIHFFSLAVAVRLSGFELVLFRVAGGALAYALVIALPFILKNKILTSYPLSYIQSFYIFYVWLIFFATYLSRISGKTPTATGAMPTYYALTVVTALLLLFHLIGRWRARLTRV